MSNQEIDKEEIKKILIEIVEKVHTHPLKKRIKFLRESIAIACPYCGDSKKNPRQKRGHLFLESLKFYCYNEGCKSDILKLCKDFSINIDLDKVLLFGEKIKFNSKNILLKKRQIDFSEIKYLFDIKDVLRYFQNSTNIKKLRKTSYNSYVSNFLNRRMIDYEHPMFYEALNKDNKPILVIMNVFSDKVCSLQTRNVFGNEREYRVLNWSDLKNLLFPEMEVSEEETKIYDLLSLYMGLGFVNFDKTIHVFEGFLDACFVPNSIGLTGLNVDTTPLEENQLEIKYILDNPLVDKTAKKKTEEYIKKGRTVFLWKKFFDHLLKKAKNPHELEKIIMKIKDFNDLAIMGGDDVWFKYKLEKFFSVDMMDLLYIPK